MKLVRKDYNKSNRCPGWSGSGIRQYPWEAKQNNAMNCPSGKSGHYDDMSRIDDWSNWNFHKCDDCGTVTLPYVLRVIDPEYWYSIKLPNLKQDASINWQLFKKDIKATLLGFKNRKGDVIE